MFQKCIYQVWFQGCSEVKDAQFRENIKNWRVLNPGWKYTCLSNTELRKICYDYSFFCGKAYDKAQYMHAKIDLGKVVSLYFTGGIMVDMDMYILRSLESLKEMESFLYTKQHRLGVSRLNLNFFESLCFSGKFTTYNNAVIVSTKQNPVLKAWIDNMISNILGLNDTYSNKGLYIGDTTGPNLFTKIVSENSGSSVIHEFDYTIFEPCETFGDCKITKDTVSIHKFELTWIPDSIKWLMKFYFLILRPLVPVLLIFVIYKLFYKYLVK